VRSDRPADDNDTKSDGISGLHGKTTKIKKCCVSFKLSSPGSACSCRSLSADNNNVCGVLDAGRDVSEKNTGFIADMLDEQDDYLLQSINSENLQPESLHAEPYKLLTSEAECNQSNTSCSESVCNSVSLEHFSAVACNNANKQPDDHLCVKQVSLQHSVTATPENVNRQSISDFRVSQKSGSQEELSLIANSLIASQKVQTSSIHNASVMPVSSNGCELNFSFMDDELLACFTHSDNFPCDIYSSEIDVSKKDVSENVCSSVESDMIATETVENVQSRESSVSCDDGTVSLCQALSAVKVAVAESVESGITDFMLPDSQYGEIIRLKLCNEDSSLSTLDKDVLEEMAHSIGSSSMLSPRSSQSACSVGQQSIRQLQQKQR